MANNETVRSFLDQVLSDISSGVIASNPVSDITSANFSQPQEVHNFMIGWSQAEGGGITNKATFNPLNTERVETGSVNFSTGKAGSGVQAYPDNGAGIKATVDALQNGLYGALVNALKTGDLIGLGFTARGAPSFSHKMSRNIASELSTWGGHGGQLDNAGQQYVLGIMHLAGIPNPTIEGGTISGSQAGQSQSAIDAYGNKVLGVDTVGQTLGGAISNGLGFTLWPTNDIIKVVAGTFLVMIAAALFLKMQFPSSPIAQKIPGFSFLKR